MMEEYKKFKVAAVQASPVLPMNMKATVDKACTLIEEAGKKGAQLVVFPETLVPCTPIGPLISKIQPNGLRIDLSRLRIMSFYH